MGGIRDERRTRNLIGVAFFGLVILYTFKLSFPGKSVHTAYTAVSSYIPSSSKQPSITTQPTSESADVCPAYCMPIPAENTTSTPEASSEVAIDEESAEDTTTETSETYVEDVVENINSSTNELLDTITPPSSDPAKKIAVIIENRPLMSVIPLITHFAGVLGEEWPIIVYTKAENIGLFSASSAFQRLIKIGRIEVRTLPLTVLIDNSESVSLFLTKPWFWESLVPAEHILMFQSDSMLCSNAARSVDDFLEWDFVGAPIAKGKGAGYNGGLSLRRRSKILEVIRRWDFAADPAIRTNKYLSYEDQWYYNKLSKLEGSQLPSMEVARTFSVETIDYPNPLGVHQVTRWQTDHMRDLDVWCPEWRLCATDFIKEKQVEKEKVPADKVQAASATN